MLPAAAPLTRRARRRRPRQAASGYRVSPDESGALMSRLARLARASTHSGFDRSMTRDPYVVSKAIFEWWWLDKGHSRRAAAAAARRAEQEGNSAAAATAAAAAAAAASGGGAPLSLRERFAAAEVLQVLPPGAWGGWGGPGG